MATIVKRVCAFCATNAARKDCPNNACGCCCSHKSATGHAVTPHGYARLSAANEWCEKALREAEAKRRKADEARLEKQRRKDVLEAAHAKARSGRHLNTECGAESTLLALPDEILEAIMRALASEHPALAARLACEHSLLLAAFGRALCIVCKLSKLPAAPSLPLFVHFADLSKWPAAPLLLPRLTLLQAYVASVSGGEELAAEERIDEINNSVILIHELEVDCGSMTLDVPDPPRQSSRGCPNCGRAWCKCSAEGELDDDAFDELDFRSEYEAQKLEDYEEMEEQLEDAAMETCFAQAAQDARETLAFLRELGLTVVVRKLTFRVSFSRYKTEPGGFRNYYEYGEYCNVPVEDWEDDEKEEEKDGGAEAHN